MNSPAYDLKERLIDLYVIESASSFVSEEPDSPNNCVTFYDTGGSAGHPGIELYNQTVMVRVRDISYQAAYELQHEIKSALIVPESFTINDTVYIGVWLQSEIIGLGRDENNRSILTANYRLERQAQ